MEIGKDLGLATARKITRDCTQAFVPIKDIIEGVIITTDNQYIKVLEITPVNFAMNSPEEQVAILEAYRGWLKTAPRSFQIKCMTKQTRVEGYIQSLENAIKNESSTKCAAMAADHMQFLKTLARTGSEERHFYLIFSYEPESEFFRKKDRIEILEALRSTTDRIKSDFAEMGNRIVESINSDAEIAEFLYGYYNKNSVNHFPFENRVSRIVKDSCIVNDVAESDLSAVDVRDLVAPRSIDTMNTEYMLVNGIYRTHVYLRSDGYPYKITPSGWLSNLISFGAGYDVDIFYNRESSTEMLGAVRSKLKFTRLKYNERSEDSYDVEDVADSLGSLRYLRAAIKGQQDVYNMVTMITIYAYTLEELYEKKKILYQACVKADLGIGECSKFQEEAFFSAGPFNRVSDKIYSLAHRNLTTDGVVASYPYTSFSLADKNGILLGVHKTNNSLAICDIFDANKYANANMSIFGESGRGKTYSLLSLTSRLRYHGIQNFILAPDKQDEFRRICDEVDGIFVDMSSASEQRINPFDIWPKDSIDNRLLGGESYTEKSWLIDKVDNLKIWLTYLIPGITPAQKITLEKALLRMYERKGITENNDSIYLDSERKVKKEMPIISDFIEDLKESEGVDPDIPTILSQFTEGAARNMNGQTNVNLENKYIVFGLENLKGDLQAPTMFLVLDFIWGVTRANKTQKKVIALDEGWKFLASDNPQVAEFVIEIFKIIRGFGGGAIFSTQSVLDLYKNGSSFGDAILSCSHSNIVLGMTAKELGYIRKELNLSETECRSISKYRRGEALLCAGANHIPIHIRASQREHIAFTTKRSDLEQIAAQKRKEVC